MVMERRQCQFETDRDSPRALEGVAMNVVFKISRELLEIVRRDLARPHDFAWERVGFLAGRPGALGPNKVVILAQSYHPVANEDYVEDNSVGAMMGSAAIRKGLQYAYANQVSMFHIHQHEHFGAPRFSPIDIRESAIFVPDFWHVCPSYTHGAIVLSKDLAVGLCWYPGILNSIPIREFVVVGAPMEVIAYART
jgi:hypothetical protein